MIQARKLGGRVVGRHTAHKDQRFHAVQYGRYEALCGAKPHRHSQGWAPGTGTRTTCSKCLKKLAEMEVEANEPMGVAV